MTALVPMVSIMPGVFEGFQRNRSKIESLVRRKYLSWPVEEPQHVLVTEHREVTLSPISSAPRSTASDCTRGISRVPARYC